MRWVAVVVLALGSAFAGAGFAGEAFAAPVRAPFHVTYDADHLDLDKHLLYFQLSRRAGSAELVALGEDGAQIGTGAVTYQNEPPGTWLPISWSQPAGARVLKLKLRVVSADKQVTNVELIPWSVTVEHEDVTFATDSAAIERGEDAKLDASLAAITELVKRSGKLVPMQLYVAGHTDTVGPSTRNQALSLARARAIAAYFRSRGLALPIAFAGFGEAVLKVSTPDETDERRNRRADYVIAPVAAPPPFKGPYLKARVAWKRLP